MPTFEKHVEGGCTTERQYSNMFKMFMWICEGNEWPNRHETGQSSALDLKGAIFNRESHINSDFLEQLLSQTSVEMIDRLSSQLCCFGESGHRLGTRFP